MLTFIVSAFFYSGATPFSDAPDKKKGGPLRFNLSSNKCKHQFVLFSPRGWELYLHGCMR